MLKLMRVDWSTSRSISIGCMRHSCNIFKVDEMSIGMSYEVLRGDTTLMKGDTRYACVSSAYQAVAIRSDWKFKMEATRNATR